MNSRTLIVLLFFLYSHLFLRSVAEKPASITIDGQFGDWDSVPLYDDPEDNFEGTVYQDSVPDCHNITTIGRCDVPSHVYNPIIDLVEYGLAHNGDNLYAYMRVVGDITNTTVGEGVDAGRTYLTVMLDLDDNLTTGFCGNEGGYYPEACGYDMSFKIEIFNGSVNLAMITLHTMHNQSDYDQARKDILNNSTVNFRPALYRPYSQWVYWDDSMKITDEEKQRCLDGPYALPGSNHPVICFVAEMCNCSFRGVMNYAFSADNHSIEFSAPYRTFMNLPDGTAALKSGNRITASFHLQTSNQNSDPQIWASDSSWPIRGYLFEPTIGTSDNSLTLWEDRLIAGAIGLVIGATVATIVALLATTMMRKGYKAVA